MNSYPVVTIEHTGDFQRALRIDRAAGTVSDLVNGTEDDLECEHPDGYSGSGYLYIIKGLRGWRWIWCDVVRPEYGTPEADGNGLIAALSEED